VGPPPPPGRDKWKKKSTEEIYRLERQRDKEEMKDKMCRKET
jgi:hypothetical protein